MQHPPVSRANSRRLQHGPQAQLHTLANGLQVALLEDHSAPVVALQTWVRFGSADEDRQVAGIAHVFEHMLFKGTERFPHGETAALIEGAGGTINAWTSYDETVYHVTIASKFWQTGFDVLSDAVLHALFEPTELDREKEVVLEELWRGKDSPDREVSERLFALAFTTHPYQRPIIGYEDTVTGITRDDMIRVFRTWYVPNNMIFVAVGDFDTPTLLAALEKRFGGIDVSPLPPRPRLAEPLQTTPRVASFAFQAELARVEIGFPGVDATDPRLPALDVLSDMLGAGYNSALYIALKRRHNVVHDVYAYNYTPLDHGLFLLGASCLPDQAAAAVRGLMQQVYRPTLTTADHEFEAAKTRILSHFVHARETYQGIAEQLGRFTLTYGDPNYGMHYMATLEGLSFDDVREAAATFLDPQRANIVTLFPTGTDVPDAETLLTWTRQDTTAPLAVLRPAEPTSGVSVTTLPGGSQLIVQTDRKTPLVSIRLLCDGGQRAEPAGKAGLARLLTAVWDRGTELRSAAEIEHELDRLGALLSATSDRDTVQLGARFLTETFAEGLEVFFDILQEPAWAAKEVAREQADQLRELDSLKEHRFHFALQQFLQVFYGSHPYNRLTLGRPEELATVTPDDLATYHRTMVQPERLVFSVVGDITADEVVDHFAHTAPATLFHPALPPSPSYPAAPTWATLTEHVIELPGQQTHIMWGFPTVTMQHPDRFALRVLDTILGGMGGRLFVELRDRKSLAYSVTTFDAYPVDGGFFILYIACSPDKETAAIGEFERVLHEVQHHGVTPEELDRATTYLEGVIDIGLQSTSQRTATYGTGALHAGQWNAFERFRTAVRQMTIPAVQGVAQRYLEPSRSVRLILRAQR